MPKIIEIRAVKSATFEGDQWEPIFNNCTGELLGLHALGTNCTVVLSPTNKEWLGEFFKVPNNEKVFLRDGLAVLRQNDQDADVE